MRDEIKVGAYIRTKDGNIGTIKHKITVHENDKFIRNEYRTSFNAYYYTDKQMQECSWKIENNIIYLLEVGDFINNRCIEKIDYCDDHIDVAFVEDMDWYGFDDELLKGNTIVTKEQFKSVEYKLEE